MNREKLEETIKHALAEVLITGGFGVKIPKKAVDIYWEIFNKSFGWRLDQFLNHKPVKSKTKFNNCLFIKIPKTGTTSINQIVQQYGGHKTAIDWRKEFDDKQWRDMFKFTIVRNPYDRFVSGFYHCRLHEKYDLNECILKNNYEWFLNKNNQVFKRQVDYVYEGDKLLIDYIGRFEELTSSWFFIAVTIGATITTDKGSHAILALPHEQKNPIKRQELTQETKDRLYEWYKDDFEKFEYDKM
nr:hypothetical protein 2 [Gammaproteobacteria bacterium]